MPRQYISQITLPNNETYYIKDASALHSDSSSAEENNAVYLSGFFGNGYRIQPGQIFAETGFDGTKNVYNPIVESNTLITNASFPTKCELYVNIGDSTYIDSSLSKVFVYTSHDNIDISTNGGSISNFTAGDDVFLMVSFNSDYTFWSPLSLIGTQQLYNNFASGFVIRLGTYNKAYTGSDNVGKFMFEQKKQWLYWDGSYLYDFDVWKAGSGGGGGSYLPLSGGTMSGVINMDGHKISNLAIGTQSTDAARLDQVLLYDSHSGYYTADGDKICDVGNPTVNTDAANKKYVDDAVNGISLNPTILQDRGIGSLDGSKDINIAYFWYPERASAPNLGFSTKMSLNTVCHIFVYRAGGINEVQPGTYSTGTFAIPNNITVGSHIDSSNNYVWINGILTNGGNISGSGNVTTFTTPTRGMLEISIMLTKYNNTQYRTIIKVDAEAD